MSVIHLRHIKGAVEGNLTGLIDLSDWASASETDRERVFLSRGLAAFAVMELGAASPEEAAAAVTDGGNDNGIDALYVDLPRRRVLVVQSKWDSDGRGSPSLESVHKLRQGFEDLSIIGLTDSTTR